MKLTFVGYETPSGNKFHKQHWRVYSAHKKKVVGMAMDAFAVVGQAHGERKMAIKFTAYRKRLLDTDNLQMGLKAFRDALVVAGFLRDDSPKWAVFQYEQFTLKDSPWEKTPGLVIQIQALD